MSHSSPISVTFEPVTRENTKKIPTHHIERTHARFFKELRAIKLQEPVSAELDEYLLEHIRSLTSTAEPSFKTVTISNGHERVALDRQFDSNIRKLLDEETVSYGSVEGKLDAANIHGSARRFWIYPTIGPERIRCDFLPGTSEQIREALGHYIRAEGMKYFRPQNPHPFRVAVRDFEILSEEELVHFKDLKGIAPTATGPLSAVDFIKVIRDEWG